MPGSRPGGATRGTTAMATTAPSTAAPIRAAIDEGFDICKFSFGGRRAWGASRLGAVAPRQHHERGGSPALRGLIAAAPLPKHLEGRSEEPTSELQSLMRISYAVFCSTTKIHTQYTCTTCTN